MTERALIEMLVGALLRAYLVMPKEKHQVLRLMESALMNYEIWSSQELGTGND